MLLVAQQKGRNLEERLKHNYGMAHPEGYRKALSKMELAAKFGLPIICVIDTAGAYPGIGAEERGQAYQIAFNLREMSRVNTPIVCVVIGEGGSGGALGIGIGDHIAMLQFSYYSVISPEGCAGILWKHPKHADKAAHALRFTSKDLLGFGIIDEVIPEPIGGAHRDHRKMATSLKASILTALKNLSALPASNCSTGGTRSFARSGSLKNDRSRRREARTAKVAFRSAKERCFVAEMTVQRNRRGNRVERSQDSLRMDTGTSYGSAFQVSTAAVGSRSSFNRPHLSGFAAVCDLAGF